MQIRDNYTLLRGTEVDSFCAFTKLRMLSIDTETYYDKDYLFTPSGKPVITRFIKGNPQNRPFCVTLYDLDTKKGYYVLQEDIKRLLPVFQSSTILKIFHNLNYDMHMLLNEDMELLPPLADTIALAVLTDEERKCKIPTPEGEEQKYKKSKALKDLGYHFFGEDAHDYEDEVKRLLSVIAEERGVDKSEVYYKDVAERCFELMVNYATFDTELTGRLFLLLYPELERQELLNPFSIDMQAIISGVKIERNGMKVDIDKAKLWKQEIEGLISELQRQVYALLGGNEDFNYNSSAELVQAYELLFDVKWEHFTEKEEFSTTAQVLKQFYSTTEEMKAFTDIILELRSAEKVCNTFIEGIIYYVQHTGRVHPNFHVVADDFGKGGTVTGRLSSSAPNFQNFPKEPFELGGKKYEIRELFVADEGRIFVYMDAD
jgi:DNA polymerase-1